MKINWIVDELLGGRAEHSGFPSIADAAEELGHNVYRTKYKPFSEHPFTDQEKGPHATMPNGSCVVAYGTVQFCNQLQRKNGRDWTPCLYFNQNVKNWSKFAPYLSEDLLNDDYVILPFDEVCGRLVRGELGPSIFIKPESGLKEFTGQVLDAGMLYSEIKKQLSPHGIIDPTILCVVARPKAIKAEFRYVIVNRRVITGSEYRWDNKLDVRLDTHPVCDAMAKKAAEAEWQADTVYVCDVALVENRETRGGDLCIDEVAKVIELNAFSSSGLYACDTRKIVEAVSEAAVKEWSGEMEDV